MNNPLTIIIEDRILRAVNVFTCKDESRFILNGVHLHLTSDTTAILSATDGRRLIRIMTNVLVTGFQSPFQIILPSKLIDDRVDGICWNHSPKSKSVLTIQGEGTRTISKGDIKGESSITRKEIAGKFPNVVRVIPKKFSLAKEVTVNFSYYGDLAKVSSYLGDRSAGGRFYQAEDNGVYVIQADFGPYEVLALIMPMRLSDHNDHLESLPDWAFNPNTDSEV